MERLKEAEATPGSRQSEILELARGVHRAQQLRDAELRKAPRAYDKALEGSVQDAAEFLKTVQKADVLYERAMQTAFRRYREGRSA
jgi:hypothetical protein